MLLLALLFGFAVYLLINVFIVWFVAKIAGRKVGRAVAIGLFLVVFWDLIPVYTVYSYQCMTNAGFTVHKTLDEWKRENPGVWETLNRDPEKTELIAYRVKTDRYDSVFRLPDNTELKAHYGIGREHSTTDIKRSDGTEGYLLNQRFAWITLREKTWYVIGKIDSQIVDIKTGEIIAQRIGFSSRTGGLLYGSYSSGTEFNDYKLWLNISSCWSYNKDRSSFYQFKRTLQKLGDEL